MVLDTNVLASGIVYRKSIPGRIVGAWHQGAVNAVLSRHILAELARILPRFNHKLQWQPSDFEDFIDILLCRLSSLNPSPCPARPCATLTTSPFSELSSLPGRTTSSPATGTF